MATNINDTVPTPESPQIKVISACQRCKKQKLKCDVRRPCTLCTRAGVECLATQRNRWKTHAFEQAHIGTATAGRQTRARTRLMEAAQKESSHSAGSVEAVDDSTAHVHSGPLPASVPSANTPWNSTSTIVLVEEAFHHCNGDIPEDSVTSSLAAEQWREGVSSPPYSRLAGRSTIQGSVSESQKPASTRKSQRLKIIERAAQEMGSILPKFDALSLLVDNYFDKIHWFTLVFHQDVFRKRVKDLYRHSGVLNSADSGIIGRLSVLLAVCGISLEHLSALQSSTLRRLGVDPKVLQDTILSSLRVKLLDILSLGSLETVQACVLLGTYYLNRGEPELAWPLCGCALRTAQALNLHRRLPMSSSQSTGQQNHDPALAEARKRCWWAVYEFETLCSLIYGFPLSINDEDCDIEPLDAHDELSSSTRSGADGTITLLSYKCAMSQLSMLIRLVIKEFYGNGGSSYGGEEGLSRDPSHRLRGVQRVTAIDAKILSWYMALPARLRMGELCETSAQGTDELFGKGSPAEFEEHLFHLQAMVLKLAFESVRILLHRPLLSSKLLSPMHKSTGDQVQNPFKDSLRACRTAAVQVSLLGSTSIFNQVSETYAVAFVSFHLLTAGITLCIMATMDPLGTQAHASKIGVHRLMKMQSILQSNSIVAAQGLSILRQLMSLVMSKEMEKMFEFTPKIDRIVDTEHSSDTVVDPQQQRGSIISEPPFETQAGALTNTETTQTLDEVLGLSTMDGHDPGVSDHLTTGGEFPDIGKAGNSYEDPNFFELISLDLGSLLGNDTMGQDQGWIWGSDYGI